MYSSPSYYPPQGNYDYLSESTLSEDGSYGAAVPPLSSAANRYPDYDRYETDFGANEVVQEHSFLSPPRPLNPELDIHINPDSIAFPTLKDPIPAEKASSIPPKQIPIQPTPIPEKDYQLALIPSSDSSSSSVSDEERWKEADKASDINAFLQSCGLPALRFSQLKADEKDAFYQSYIRQVAAKYSSRESLLRSLTKQSLLTSSDKPAVELLKDVNSCVCATLSENALSSRRSLIENVRCIRGRLRKDEQKLSFMMDMMGVIEDDTADIPLIADRKIADPAFNKKADSAMRRLMNMRKYRLRYKSMLYMKYKVVEMLNCMTGGNIDKFTDNEKLIPILEKHKYPLSRIKDILQSHSYTPEWKIRELKELFNLKYHSSIIGMPTEMWVRKMMEYAHIEGLIDPADFVRERIRIDMQANQYVNKMSVMSPQFKKIRGAESLTQFFKDHGVKQYMATSTPRSLIGAKLAPHKDMIDRFDGIVTADDVVHGKPAPDIFLKAAELAGVPPSRCIVFEDSPFGVQGGLAGGMRVVGIVYPGADLSLYQGCSQVVANLGEFDSTRFGMEKYVCTEP
ncbi:beta-phosphoglucomutase [Blastocystis sp. ATCC 50177/Nand II]|uniref:Beta-phosphoglucomutase n=1 Tax=Blastocystis sp. subtype 1 (strain ATCC 50177 / NandII) TaxID=478820 RepID=A0A196SPN8_BLAHN|nr:beta-phosphoglucomutase [Blastocystis sp. ATCC 50177/Nand II]